MAAAVLLLAPQLVAGRAAEAQTTTVVSLNFDDGTADQSVVPSMLDAHGMQGTFVVNSGNIDTPGYLTWTQLSQFQADGHEIAGHTVNHIDLTAVDTATAKYQICEDRARLLNFGLSATDFAYPFGNGYNNSTIRSLVTQCGYNSARRAWGLISSCGTATPCYYPPAESIPPADYLGIRTAQNPQSDTSLATLESYVTVAEQHGGGWVPIVFHRICDSCDPYSTSQAELQQFLDWLQPRAANGTVERTIQQVVGTNVQPSPGTVDQTPPVSTITCNGTSCGTGWYDTAIQVALAATDPGGSGLEGIRFTTDGTDPTLSSPEYTGPFTVATTNTVKYRAWDNAGNAEATKSQLIQIGTAPDTTPPVSSVSCNGTACLSGWYDSAVQVFLSATDGGGSGVASIHYTTDGTDPTLSSPTYTLPFDLSATTTLEYRAWDNAGNVEATKTQLIEIDTAAPVSSVSCNGATCGTGWYTSPVQVALSATDTGGSGVASIHYTTDGTDPSLSSPTYSAPFTLATSTTVNYRAWDNAGNVESTETQVVRIDTACPSVKITSPRSGATVTGTVKVAATATDLGSGVAKVTFYVDGRIVATDTAAPYGFSWNTRKWVRGPHTLTATAVDVAGNTTTSSPVSVTVR